MARFERSLRAGVKITVSVTRRGYIGKRTTFVIRRGAPPLRSDRCLSTQGPRHTLPGGSLMTDRPIAAVLAAARRRSVFVAAFSAAAVMRPDQRRGRREHVVAHGARRGDRGGASVATLVAPSLSRVAALPALHLPKAQAGQEEGQEGRRAEGQRAGHAARRVTPRPPRGRRRRPPRRRVVTPPRSHSGGVERRQDLRLRGMIRRDPHGPSGRACGGWPPASPWRCVAAGRRLVRRRPDRRRSGDVRRAGLEGARRRPGAAEGVLGLGARRRSRPRCPGSRARRPGRPTPASATTVSVALVPADDPALVPAALVKEADGGLPRPEKARGRRARGARVPRRADRRRRSWTSTPSRPRAAC